MAQAKRDCGKELNHAYVTGLIDASEEMLSRLLALHEAMPTAAGIMNCRVIAQDIYERALSLRKIDELEEVARW